jgi:tRNA-splicing ligase RtcB
MFRVIFEPERGQRVPVRVWARAVSPETVRQLQRLASQRYVVEFVAAMADAHVAEGVAVGSVFATEHTVVPGALGGDLGCGMSAIRIAADADSLGRRELDALVRTLGRAIPTGDATHRGVGIDVPDALLEPALSTRALEHTREALARRHLGTLGGGNHFLELDRDAEGGLWLLVHSGSRGLGAAVAAHHARVAETEGGGALNGLDVTNEQGAAYLNDLGWALAFARANREALAARALEVLADVLAIAVDASTTVASTTTSWPVRPGSGASSSCIAKARWRSPPRRWLSSLGRWGQRATSSRGSEARRRSGHARTGPAG